MTNGTKKESRWYHNSFLRVTLVSAGLLFGTAAILKNCGPGTPTCPPNSSLVCLKSKEPIAEPPRNGTKHPEPTKNITKADKPPTKQITKVEKQSDAGVKTPEPVAAKQEDGGSGEVRTLCEERYVKPPTAEQKKYLGPVSDAAIEGVMNHKTNILGDSSKAVPVVVTLYVCKDIRKVVSVSGAKGMEKEVLEDINDKLKSSSAEPKQEIAPPGVIYRFPVTLRPN